MEVTAQKKKMLEDQGRAKRNTAGRPAAAPESIARNSPGLGLPAPFFRSAHPFPA